MNDLTLPISLVYTGVAGIQDFSRPGALKLVNVLHGRLVVVWSATKTIMSMSSILFCLFPFARLPSNPAPSRFALTSPTLWIVPPRSLDDGPLSSDVECLKWQAYLALRSLTDIAVRCDIQVPPDGALDERLPNLQLPVARGNS
jgi:hypothetical protein